MDDNLRKDSIMEKRFPGLAARVSLTAAAASLTLMSGCGQSNASHVVFTPVQADAAIIEAKHGGDPWKTRNALETIATRLLDTCDSSGWSGTTTCGDLTRLQMQGRIDKINEEADRYLLEAVKQAHPAAVRVAFERKDIGKPFVDLVPVVVQAAEKAGGTPADRDLLLMTGRFYGEGRYVVRDTSRAVGYLARAWAAGDKQAAAESAMLFKQINDTRNAYLWALRCVGSCERGPYMRLEELEADMSAEAAKQAQKAAGDPSVVELDTKL